MYSEQYCSKTIHLPLLIMVSKFSSFVNQMIGDTCEHNADLCWSASNHVTVSAPFFFYGGGGGKKEDKSRVEPNVRAL